MIRDKVLPAVVAVTLVLLGVGVIRGGADRAALRRQARAQHRQQVHQNDALRSIMCFAETYVRHNARATATQKRDALAFYSAALRRARLEPC